MTKQNTEMTKKKTPGVPEQRATRALFFAGGFATASWAPLVPYLKARLGIGEDILGMLLLCIGIGSLLTMPLSGAAATRYGCRRVLTVACLMECVCLVILAQVSSLPLTIVTLLVFGAFMGCLDVVVNVEAVIVEKAAGRRLMSGMHGFWSVGGFAGAAAFGLWVGTLDLTPMQSTAIAIGIVCGTLAFFYRHLLPYGGTPGGALIAIPRGIVIFIGLITMIAFLIEGAIMDWGAVFLHDMRGFDLSVASSGFAIFSFAMLTMRLFGDRTVTRFGQKPVVLGGALLALAGFLLLIFAPLRPLVLAGFFIIGVGSANIVPVFYSLLGRQKVMPISLAVPAVSTLGYLGVLMGPATIGFLAHVTSLTAAFGFLATLVFLEGCIAAYVYHKIDA